MKAAPISSSVLEAASAAIQKSGREACKAAKKNDHGLCSG